jgi:hypothetical protein
MKAYIVGLIAFMTLGGLASVANDTDLMQSGMGRAWLASQGVDVQNTLDFVLGALVVVTLVAYVVFTGKTGIWLMSNSTSMGDPRERSQAQNAMLHVLYALMGVLYSSKERVKLNGFKVVDKLSKILVVLFLSISTALADANDTVPLKPNLATGWAGLPPDVQKWVMWIISVAFVFFVAVAIIYPIFRTLPHHSSLIFLPHRFIVNALIESRQF